MLSDGRILDICQKYCKRGEMVTSLSIEKMSLARFNSQLTYEKNIQESRTCDCVLLFNKKSGKSKKIITWSRKKSVCKEVNIRKEMNCDDMDLYNCIITLNTIIPYVEDDEGNSDPDIDNIRYEAILLTVPKRYSNLKHFLETFLKMSREDLVTPDCEFDEKYGLDYLEE